MSNLRGLIECSAHFFLGEILLVFSVPGQRKKERGKTRGRGIGQLIRFKDAFEPIELVFRRPLLHSIEGADMRQFVSMVTKQTGWKPH